MNVIHINRPDTIAVRRITRCPTCERPRRFAAWDAFWYGAIWTCLGCGDRFGDGERLERPFARGWREKSKREARETWDQAVRLLGPEHRVWLNEQMSAHETAAAADAPAVAADETEPRTPERGLSR